MSKAFFSHHEFSQLKVASSSKPVSTQMASATLTSADSGSLLFFGSTTGTALTLPAASAAAGLSFEVAVAATAANHSLVAPAAELVGVLTSDAPTDGVSLATGAAKTSLTTGAGSALGDHFKVTSNGTNWFLSGSCATSDGATFA